VKVTIDLGDTWAAISVFFLLASGGLGVWWRLQFQISQNILAIDKKACKRDLAQLEVHLAEQYVSKESLREIEQRWERTLADLRREMKQMNDKLDQILLMQLDKKP